MRKQIIYLLVLLACAICTFAQQNQQNSGPPVPRCNPNVQTLMNTARVFSLNGTTPASSDIYTMISRLPTRGMLYRYVDYSHNAGGHIDACNADSNRQPTDIRNYATDLLTSTNTQTFPQWIVNGQTVSQNTTQGSASAYLYPLQLRYVYEVSGAFSTGNDLSGFMGLVFGYKSPTDFFLIAFTNTQNGPNAVLRRINNQMRSNNTGINSLADILPNQRFNGISNELISFRVPIATNTRYNYILTVDTLGGYIQLDMSIGNGPWTKAFTYTSAAFTTASGFPGFFSAMSTRVAYTPVSVCVTRNPQIISTGTINDFRSGLRRVIYVPPTNTIGPQNGFDWLLTDGRTNSQQCQQRINVTYYRDVPVAFPLTYNLIQGSTAVIYFLGTSIESANVSSVLLGLPNPLLGTLYQCAPSADGQCARGAQVQNRITDSQGRAVLVLNPANYGTNLIPFVVIDPRGDASRSAIVALNVARGGSGLFSTTTNFMFYQNGGMQVLNLTYSGGSVNLTTYYTVVRTIPSYVGTLQFVNDQGQTVIIRDGTRVPSNVTIQYYPAPNSQYNDGTAANYPAPASFIYTTTNGDLSSAAQYVPVSIQPLNTIPVAVRPNLFYSSPNGTVIALQGISPSGSPMSMCLTGFPPRGGRIYQVNSQTVNGRTVYTQGQLIPSQNTPTQTLAGPGQIRCVTITNTQHPNGSPYTVSRLWYVPDPSTYPNGDTDRSSQDSFTYIFSDGRNVSRPESVAQIQTISGPPPPVTGTVIPRPIVIPYNSTTGQIVQLSGTEQGPNGEQIPFTSGIYITSPCRDNTLYQRNTDGSRGALIDPSAYPVKVTNPNGQIIVVPQPGTSGANYCFFGFIVQSNATSMISSEALIPVTVSPPANPNNNPNSPFVALGTNAFTNVNKSVPIVLRGAPDSPTSPFAAYVTQYPARGTLFQYSATTPDNIGDPIPSSASIGNPQLVTDPQRRVVFMPVPNESSRQPGRGIPNYYTSFQYVVKNPSTPFPQGMSNAAEVKVGVRPRNLPPTATKRTVTTTLNKPINFFLTATDPDTAQRNLRYTLIDLPQRGSLHILRGPNDTPNSNNTVRLVPGRGGVPTPVVVPGGALTYNPPRNMISTGNPLVPVDDFTYTVSDGTTRVVQKIFAYVIPQDNSTANNNNNNATNAYLPTATTQSPQTVPEGTTPRPIRVSGVDPVYPDSQLTYIITRLPTKGTLQQGNNVPITSTETTVARLVDDKTMNRRPFETIFYANRDPYANGNNYDSFTYVVQNPAGVRSAPKTVAINVTPLPQAPLAKVLSVPTINETAQFLIIDLGAYDPDINDAVNSDVPTAFITRSPTRGRLYQVDTSSGQPRPAMNQPIVANGGTGVQVYNYRPRKNQAGSVAYIRAANSTGSNVDQITFYIRDRTNLASAPLTFSINVRPTKTAPLALGLSTLDGVLQAQAGQSTRVAVTWKADSQSVRITLTGFPDVGRFVNTDNSRLDRDYPVVKNRGTFMYVASAGYTGVQRFQYTVTDLNNGLTSKPLDVYIQIQ